MTYVINNSIRRGKALKGDDDHIGVLGTWWNPDKDFISYKITLNFSDKRLDRTSWLGKFSKVYHRKTDKLEPTEHSTLISFEDKKKILLYHRLF